jgi:hypothetical protein
MKPTRINWGAALRAGAWGNHFIIVPGRRPALRLALALLLAGSCLATAQRTRISGTMVSGSTVPGATDYAQFSAFITDRNIFNKSRFSHTTRAVTPQPPSTRPTPSFTLCGIMSYEKGEFAFFDGNEPNLQKVLYPTDTNGIAVFTVADITTTNVVLQTADKKEMVPIAIGQGMRLVGNSWQKIEQGGYFGGGGGGGGGSFDSGGRSRGFGGRNQDFGGGGGGADMMAPAFESPSIDTSTEPSTETPSSSSALEENDVLKKLMQQREQELK